MSSESVPPTVTGRSVAELAPGLTLIGQTCFHADAESTDR